MTLIEFWNMFYSLGSDIEYLVIIKNGKRVSQQSIGDTRFIKPEYKKAKVKKFTFSKRTHALYVILEDEEETK